MTTKRTETQLRPSVGDRIDVDVVDLNHDGGGVARTRDGFVLFVDGALPGEVAHVKVTRIRPRHGDARLIRIVQTAEERVQPKCPVAGVCGGCAMQHLSYNAQVAWKEESVRQAVMRIAGLEPTLVGPIIPMERPYAYRNKAQYPVAVKDGRVVLGFYRRRSHDVVPTEECLIQHPLAVEIGRAARDVIEEFGLSVYNETTHRGFVRHVIARVSFSREQAMAILVTRDRSFPQADAWVKELRRRVPALVSVVQNVNPERTNVIMGPESLLLWGAEHLVESIGAREYLISPGSFFQVNPLQAKHLYDVVAQDAALKPGDSVWDVYCGTGSIGIYVAGEGVRLRGVERVAAAVEDARRNARLNGLKESRFEVGKAEDVLPRWVNEGERADVVLLDPPRSGCDPRTLDAVATSEPRRIVYVSCNPATLARDLALLADRGYRALKVQPVDMFPHTPHVEAVCLLTRQS